MNILDSSDNQRMIDSDLVGACVVGLDKEISALKAENAMLKVELDKVKLRSYELAEHNTFLAHLLYDGKDSLTTLESFRLEVVKNKLILKNLREWLDGMYEMCKNKHKRVEVTTLMTKENMPLINSGEENMLRLTIDKLQQLKELTDASSR